MNTVASVSLREITKVFGRLAALRGVSHDFHPGRLALLVGANGAGKSTLLRIVSGLIAPSSGQVRAHGRLGYMAHAAMLYDELTAAENLAYFARLHGLPAARVEPALRAAALEEAGHRRVRDLSQGMRQRLSLARALLPAPDVLLLDEPFSNVDGRSAAAMVATLARLKAEGAAVIVVTHQPEILRALADETLTLAEGRIIFGAAA